MKTMSTVIALVRFSCGVSQEFESYGTPISEENAIAIESLETMEVNEETAIKLTGTIDATCQMKGCWMSVALPGGNTRRVTFRDGGFFVP